MEGLDTLDHLASAKVFFARAEVQHRVLALPEGWLKTALLIFSHLVIFPLNPKLQLCVKYSSRIRQQVSLDTEEDSDYLRLWAVVVAGMVSNGAARLALSDIASNLCSAVEIHSKEDAVKAVQSVLWSDTIKRTYLAEFLSLVLGQHDGRSLDDNSQEDFVEQVPQSAAFIQKIADNYVFGM